MILTKGFEIRALEAEFLRLGGEIDRTTPGHVQFKYQGLPTVGVHCNRVRAPRRLISMLRKMQAGTMVSSTRQPEAVIQGACGVLDVERPRAIQRPNPQRPAFAASQYDPERVREAAAELERRRAHDRAVALARALNRPEPPPYQPYVEQEAPVTWRDDVAYAPRIHDPISDADTQLQAFDDAEREGMVKWYPTAESWWKDMELWALPECRAPHGYRRYGIAIVRPAPYGLMAHHTYYNFRPAIGCLIHSEERADQEACAVVTVTPAMFARFKVGWDRGIDYTRRLVRVAGIAD